MVNLRSICLIVVLCVTRIVFAIRLCCDIESTIHKFEPFDDPNDDNPSETETVKRSPFLNRLLKDIGTAGDILQGGAEYMKDQAVELIGYDS